MCDGDSALGKVLMLPPSPPRVKKPPVVDVEAERQRVNERDRLARSRAKAGFSMSDTIFSETPFGAPLGTTGKKTTLLGG